MTILDFLIELIFPYFFAIFVWNSSWFSAFLFLVVGQLNGVFTHSGYRLPGCPDPEGHQVHHLRLNGKYGAGGPWDYLLGTSFTVKSS